MTSSCTARQASPTKYTTSFSKSERVPPVIPLLSWTKLCTATMTGRKVPNWVPLSEESWLASSYWAPLLQSYTGDTHGGLNSPLSPNLTSRIMDPSQTTQRSSLLSPPARQRRTVTAKPSPDIVHLIPPSGHRHPHEHSSLEVNRHYTQDRQRRRWPRRTDTTRAKSISMTPTIDYQYLRGRLRRISDLPCPLDPRLCMQITHRRTSPNPSPLPPNGDRAPTRRKSPHGRAVIGKANEYTPIYPHALPFLLIV